MVIQRNRNLRPLPEFGIRTLSKVRLDDIEIEDVEVDLGPVIPWPDLPNEASSVHLEVRLLGTELMEQPVFVELLDEDGQRIFYGETERMNHDGSDTILVLQRLR